MSNRCRVWLALLLVCGTGAAPVAALPATAGPGVAVSDAGAATAAADAQASPAAAGARVDAFHERLIEVMQMPDFAARQAALEDVVPQLFDVQTIARISLGRTWRELRAAQREEFERLLTQLIVATYADRFDSFSGQSFERLDTVASRDGWVVKTRLLRSTGSPVNLDYYLRDEGVFNVVADGVSDLSLRRADYTSIVRDEGYDALLGAIAAAINTHGSGD